MTSTSTTSTTMQTLLPAKLRVKSNFSLKTVLKFERLIRSFLPFHSEMAEARVKMADGCEFYCVRAFARAFGRRLFSRLTLYQQRRDRHLAELLRYEQFWERIVNGPPCECHSDGRGSHRVYGTKRERVECIA